MATDEGIHRSSCMKYMDYVANCIEGQPLSYNRWRAKLIAEKRERGSPKSPETDAETQFTENKAWGRLMDAARRKRQSNMEATRKESTKVTVVPPWRLPIWRREKGTQPSNPLLWAQTTDEKRCYTGSELENIT